MKMSTLVKLAAVILVLSYGSAAIGWSLGKAVEAAQEARISMIEEVGR